jgi:hypothetical protein
MSILEILVGCGLVAFGIVWAVLAREAERDGTWHSEHWRRCKDCDRQLVRTTDESLRAHVGHHLTSAAGPVHIGEYFRVILGLL